MTPIRNSFFLLFATTLLSNVVSLRTTSNSTTTTASSSTSSQGQRVCGMRHFASTTFAESEFPWTIKLTVQNRRTNTNNNNAESVICSGAAVSQYVAVVAANCVTGRERQRLVVALPPLSSDSKKSTKYFDVASVDIHPEFNSTSPTGMNASSCP